MRHEAHKRNCVRRLLASPSLFLIFSFFLLSSFFFLSSCSVELPSYVIPERKMERILYDYHLAQGMAEARGGDVEANRYLYVQKVFEKYQVTEAEFDTSMVWYSGHASHLTNIYKRLDARLDRTSREAGLNIPEEDKYARFTTEGDTANVWRGDEILFVGGNREDNLYSVVMPADTAYHQGDYFMFRCSNRFITPDTQREGFVLVQLCYENDTVRAATSMVNGNYDLTINIPEDRILADQKLKSINCTFYYAFDEQKPEIFRLWVISKPVLLRYHSLKETKEEAEGRDSLDIALADSLETDSAAELERASEGERISPRQFKESQEVERKIEVVEKRKVVVPQGKKLVKRRVR